MVTVSVKSKDGWVPVNTLTNEQRATIKQKVGAILQETIVQQMRILNRKEA